MAQGEKRLFTRRHLGTLKHVNQCNEALPTNKPENNISQGQNYAAQMSILRSTDSQGSSLEASKAKRGRLQPLPSGDSCELLGGLMKPDKYLDPPENRENLFKKGIHP